MSISYFDNLPKPIIGIIAGYLKVDDRARFARTCKRHLVFMPDKKDLLKIRKKERNIFYHIVNHFELNFCRICYYMTDELSTCLECRNDFNCADCSYNEICRICSESEKCVICGTEEVISCFGCRRFACFKHSVNYGEEFFYCDNCRN